MKNILRFLFLYFSTISVITVHAQKINEDSIRNVIATTKEDSIKAGAMLTYANYLIRHKKDEKSGLTILQEAYNIALKQKLPIQLTRYYLIYSNYFYLKNEWASSIEMLKQMQLTAKEISDPNFREDAVMKSNNNLAGIHYFNGDFSGALEYHLKSLEQVEKLPHNADSKATVYVNIASDYRQLNLFSKAYEYVNKITPMLKQLSDKLKASYYYELFQSQLETGKSNEVLTTLQLIKEGLINFDLNEGQKLDLRIQYHEQAGQYEMKITRNYQEALRHFQSFLKVAQEAGSDYSAVEATYNIGWALDSLQLFNEAIPILKEAYTKAMEQEMAEFALKSTKLLTYIFNKSNDKVQGFYYAKISMHLSDSITSNEKLKALNFLEAKYQARKKEDEIEKLKFENTVRELEIVKRNRLFMLLGIAGILILLLLGVLYRNAKQKQLIAEKDQKLKQEQIKFLERQQQVVSLQSMVNGQETERTRIAKDLHDGLGGLFSTIKMHLSSLQHQKTELKADPLFTKSYDMVDTASEEVRRIAHNMMPEVLIKMGLIQASKELCNSISAGKLLQASLQAYGMEKRLNASTEIMLFRIIQELLNNIIKHANATEAIIQFNRDENRLSVTVEDNGRGFNLKETDDKKHAGLESVQSRVTYLNGKLSIDSQKEVGTTVMMEFLINE